MQYYLILKVRWLFNSFLTKMFNRSTNVALAGNVSVLYDVADFQNESPIRSTNVQFKINV
jgi:hypothetical protein